MAYIKIILIAVLYNNFGIGNAVPYPQDNEDTQIPTQDATYRDNLHEIERSIYDIAYIVGGRISKDVFSPSTDQMGNLEIIYDTGFEEGASDSENHGNDNADEILEKIKTLLEENVRDEFVLPFNLGRIFGNYSLAKQSVDKLVSKYSGGIGIVYSLGYDLGIYYSTSEADPAQEGSNSTEFEFPENWLDIGTEGITDDSKKLFKSSFEYGTHLKNSATFQDLTNQYEEYNMEQSIIHTAGLLIGIIELKLTKDADGTTLEGVDAELGSDLDEGHSQRNTKRCFCWKLAKATSAFFKTLFS